MGLALLKNVPTTQPSAEVPVCNLVILGLDDRGRPHASRFAGEDARRVTAAAATMGMATLSIDGEALGELAARLPAGKLFASGKAFVPFVGQPLFDRLVAYLPIRGRDALKQRERRAPKAAASSAEDTFDTDASPEGDGAAARNSYAKGRAGGKPKSGKYPESWDKIAVGSIVLAMESSDGSWWPALIKEDRGDGMFVLTWEDWPDLAPFVRHVEQVGLLHPNYSAR